MKAQELHEARKFMSTAEIDAMIQYGELAPRIEHSDVFPDGLTCKWIDGRGEVKAEWLCQNAQVLYKQLHATFGTAYAVGFLQVYRHRITRVRVTVQALDLNRWEDDGGYQW